MTERINETGQMQMRFVVDIVDGNERLMTRTFSGVKKAATDDAVLLTAMQLGQLQTKIVKHVLRINRAELIEA